MFQKISGLGWIVIPDRGWIEHFGLGLCGETERECVEVLAER